MKLVIQDIARYLWKHKLFSLVGVYLLIAAGLKSYSGIDIGIPCLFRALFGVPCPGCGLTTAFGELMHFRLSCAFHSNPLIFIVMPAGMFYIVIEFKRFRKKDGHAEKTDS